MRVRMRVRGRRATTESVLLRQSGRKLFSQNRETAGVQELRRREQGLWLGVCVKDSGVQGRANGVSSRPASCRHRRQRLSAPGARRHALPDEV